uniref:Energy-coupling factor transporter transmembrane protein EcfT n=1 Tax=Thermofilum pendens TaxID=2269 RepID=A0A7C4BAW7_THEPE
MLGTRRGFSPSLSRAFLERVSSVLDELSEARSPSTSARLVLALGLIVNIEAAFAKGMLTPLLAVVFGAFLSLQVGKARSWLAATCLALAFSSVVALPAFAAEQLAERGILLVARSTGAAAAFTGVVAHLGWYGLLVALEQLRLPRSALMRVALTLRMIPTFTRDAARMLLAREARLFSRKRHYSWSVLASVVGDMLLLGYRRSRALAMAIEARSLGARSARARFRVLPSRKLSQSTIAPVALALASTLAFVSSM